VRDFEGKKMSKSKGNTVDPLDLMDRFGTDAVRFALARAAVPGQDTNVAEEWIEGDRRFCNKLWNAARFVLQNLGNQAPGRAQGDLALPERWIRSRLERTRQRVDDALDAYEFSEAAKTLYQFIWSEFCDWYLEMAKLGFEGQRGPSVRATLYEVLETTLRLAHPVMPFITEEIWQKLPHRDVALDSIMVSPWPDGQPARVDDEAEREMAVLQSVIVEIRRFRADHRLPPRQRIEAVVGSNGQSLVAEHGAELIALGALSDLRVGEQPEGWSRAVAGNIEVYLPMSGVVDIDAERRRLAREIQGHDTAVKAADAKLSNPGFVNGAPREVVARVRAQRDEHNEQLNGLRAQLEELTS
jgi:valyl-tRNA synthetase